MAKESPRSNPERPFCTQQKQQMQHKPPVNRVKQGRGQNRLLIALYQLLKGFKNRLFNK